MKKLFSILLLVSMLIVCLSSCNSKKYDDAFELIDNGDYTAAYEIFCELDDYKDSEDEIKRFHYMPTKIVIKGETDGTEEDYGTITISYNEQNLPSQAIASSNDGENAIVNFTYDEKGNIIKRVNTDSDGDKSISDYIYDANDNLIKQVETDDDGDTSSYDYIYNEKGNLIKKVYIDSDGDKYIEYYTYDGKDNLIKVVETDPYGDKYIYEITYRFVYIPFEFSSEEFLEGLFDL